MMKALFLTLTNLVSIGKFYVICKNQKHLLCLADKINREEFQPKSSKQAKCLKKYISLSKIISFSLYTGCTLTCGFWSIYPYTEEDGPFLPIAAYVPFNTSNSRVFGLVYAYEIIATLIGGYTDLSVDALMASLIIVICAQLHILNDSLINLNQMAKKELERKRSTWIISSKREDIINQKLIECIEHHRAIIDFADNVTGLFTMCMFWQFVVSGFVFCATFFEMTMVPVISVRFFSMVLYQYCMLLEIFPICYFGNEVIVESDRLTNSAYHSDWINYSFQVRKNLIFFMTRSQRLLKLYAGGFFTMSLDTFIKILKSSWSFVAVLIQIQNKNENID
ncbi:odorant receptor 46a-like [Diorhabda carinulata]|uniref:odorant receptor 46a-like n=1 Tax=Diorhabda carinulata TaxID=1163345 RepID=UPI0025A175D5|nr:odorant receptor 46a-like [Diorhabda carinulata]